MAAGLSDLYFLFQLFDIPFNLNNVIIFILIDVIIVIVIVYIILKAKSRKYY